MRLARFQAIDVYRPTETRSELVELISKMDGIINWSVETSGEVVVEYDNSLITDEAIEEALKGVGFRLRHENDRPMTRGPEAVEALGRSLADDQHN